MAELPQAIGWIGLGAMGLPMAQNLLMKMDAQTHFYVFDVVQEAIDQFVNQDEQRVHACSDSQDVAARSVRRSLSPLQDDPSTPSPQSNPLDPLPAFFLPTTSDPFSQDLILTMVPEGSHVRAVYLDPTTGLLAAPSLRPRNLIDCSTIDPSTSLAVLSACQSHPSSPTFHDAPVSGGVRGAENGSLTFMVGIGASDPFFSRLEQLLGMMGANIVACGGPSLGLTAKLCNNYCSATIAIAVAEAMDVGMRAGMDPRVLANVFHTSTAQSAICDDWCPVPGICPDAPASRDYRGGFRVGLMRKDVGLAVQAAEGVGAKLALGKAVLGVYEGASEDERCRDRDSRVVYRYLGGREDWKGDFPEDVELKRDQTRRFLRAGKEAVDSEVSGRQTNMEG